jgi:phosphatidate phosphatase APP1
MEVRATLLVLLSMTAIAEAKPAHLVSFGGYGSPGTVVMRGRAFKGKPPSGALARPSIAKVASTLRAFTRRDLQNPLVVVTDAASGRVVEMRGDDDGFYEVRVPGPFPPGPRRLTVALRHARYVAEPLDEVVHVVDQGVVVVSDIDDTLIHTGVVGSKLKLVARVFSQDAADLRSIDGAADALGAFAGAGYPIFYLSASPARLGPRLRQAFTMAGFPAGSLFLRHYETDGMGDPSAYKRRVLDRLAIDLPRARFVLIGDNGEKDPAIFAGFAKDTGRVAERFIRKTRPADAGDGAVMFDTYEELRGLAREKRILP